MKLHLTSAYDVHPGLDSLLDAASLDQKMHHSTCDNAADADAIVFVENTHFDDILFKRVHEHELTLAYPRKVFMYNEMDRPWDVMPGVYTCMPAKHLNKGRHRSFAYLSTPNQQISNIYDQGYERRWLFSFMGAMSHACRHDVMRLPSENGYLKDTSGFNVWNTSEQEMDLRAKEYASVLGESHFVLCPRGLGSSSIRLFETLEAGRAPVIISDQWVPPAGTDWRFALRVPENQISTIPELLKSIESEALERGEAARAAWFDNYAPCSLFNSLGDAISSIVEQNLYLEPTDSFPWNKWLAAGNLFARTTVQRLRGER